MGNVYVFNVFSETIDPLSLNGLSAGAIPGWKQPGYQPQALKVERVLNASQAPGKFYNGNNQIAISWPSGLFFVTVRIDGAEFPLNQDLMLYLSRNRWVLYNQFGVAVGEGSVMPAGE